MTYLYLVINKHKDPQLLGVFRIARHEVLIKCRNEYSFLVTGCLSERIKTGASHFRQSEKKTCTLLDKKHGKQNS